MSWMQRALAWFARGGASMLCLLMVRMRCQSSRRDVYRPMVIVGLSRCRLAACAAGASEEVAVRGLYDASRVRVSSRTHGSDSGPQFAACWLLAGGLLWALESALGRYVHDPAPSELGRAGVVGERVALLPRAGGQPCPSYISS